VRRAAAQPDSGYRSPIGSPVQADAGIIFTAIMKAGTTGDGPSGTLPVER